MAEYILAYATQLPKEIVDIIDLDLLRFTEGKLEVSKVTDNGGTVNYEKRKSKNSWVPAEHWVAGFLMHYISMSNHENFRYDIHGLDCNFIQYIKYGTGDYIHWHVDHSIDAMYKPLVTNKYGIDSQLLRNEIASKHELVRKISFSLQLSDGDEYEGGSLEFLNELNVRSTAPRSRGSLVCFDSRVKHRVTKVKKGERRALAGWVNGPRWR